MVCRGFHPPPTSAQPAKPSGIVGPPPRLGQPQEQLTALAAHCQLSHPPTHLGPRRFHSSDQVAQYSHSSSWNLDQMRTESNCKTSWGMRLQSPLPNTRFIISQWGVHAHASPAATATNPPSRRSQHNAAHSTTRCWPAGRRTCGMWRPRKQPPRVCTQQMYTPERTHEGSRLQPPIPAPKKETRRQQD